MEYPTPRIVFLLEQLSVLSRELAVHLDALTRHFEAPDKRLMKRKQKANRRELNERKVSWGDVDEIRPDEQTRDEDRNSETQTESLS